MRTEAKECYLCGATSDLTRDHLPPKSFFPKPRPNNLITVACCKTCNNNFSKDDEYFRVAASALINSNSSGRLIWKRVVQSTLPSKRIAKRIDELRNTIEPAVIRTSFGMFGASKMEFDAASIERFLIRLTKGLISVCHPEVDRNSLSFEITQIDQFKLNSIKLSGVADRFRYFGRGKGIYRHWRAFSHEDTHLGLWIHMFYDSSAWMVHHWNKAKF